MAPPGFRRPRAAVPERPGFTGFVDGYRARMTPALAGQRFQNRSCPWLCLLELSADWCLKIGPSLRLEGNFGKFC